MSDVQEIEGFKFKDAYAREQIELLKSKLNRSILLSDSYFDWNPDETIPDGERYWELFFKSEGITDYQGFNKGGIGFFQKVDEVDFLELLKNNSDNIQDKDKVYNIFVFGGYNDGFEDTTSTELVQNSISEFVQYCKENYPNAKIYIGMIGYDTNINNEGTRRRNNLNNKILPAYASSIKDTNNNTYIYLPNLNFVLHNKDYMSSDGIHPNAKGHIQLANAIHSSYNNCFTQLIPNEEYFSVTPYDEIYDNVNISLYIKNTLPVKSIRINNFSCDFSEGGYKTGSHNTSTVIGKFDTSKLLLPVYDIPFVTAATIVSDGLWYNIPVKIVFGQDGNLYFTPIVMTDEHNAWREFINISHIEIDAQEITTNMLVL